MYFNFFYQINGALRPHKAIIRYHSTFVAFDKMEEYNDKMIEGLSCPNSK